MITFEDTFDVDVPIDQAWTYLTDLRVVARCLPGGHVDEVVDGEYRGGVLARVGPISARYRGRASFSELDETRHHAVIVARGQEEHGSGSASATIAASLSPVDEKVTRVHVSAQLDISGRAAQFGRSLLTEVTGAMMKQFVGDLQTMLVTDTRQGETTGSRIPAAGGPVAGRADASDAGVLDIGRTVLLPVARKVAPTLVCVLISGAIGVLIGRRARSRSAAGWH